MRPYRSDKMPKRMLPMRIPNMKKLLTRGTRASSWHTRSNSVTTVLLISNLTKIKGINSLLVGKIFYYTLSSEKNERSISILSFHKNS